MEKTVLTEVRKQTERAITVALARALPEQRDIAWQSVLTSEAGLDSVQIMNLVMEIEDELDLSVPVEMLAEVQTLEELAERLCRLQEDQT
ncbi:MAG: acyl carrier protein [Wenzhouxiangella sp.]